MPIPVFEQEKPTPEEIEEEKDELSVDKPLTEKYSGFAIFFASLFGLALILVAEFGFRDVNRLFNAYYDVCQSGSRTADAALCPLEQYERIRLILHADVAVPLILLSGLVFLFLRGSKLTSQIKVIFFAYYGFAAYLVVRIIGETEYFFLQHHDFIGKYLIIFTIAIIGVVLVILIQQRFLKRKKDK